MKVQLQIKRENLELIKSGKKKTEWREPSEYNYKKLFKYKEDGKRHGNEDITEIEFISGYAKNRESLIVSVKRIRLVKFTRNIEIPDDNFKALEGQFSIEINLGDIVNN